MSIALSAVRSDPSPRHKTVPVGNEWSAGEGQAGLGEDVRVLHRFSMRVRFARNETIIGQADGAKLAYKVISGTVRICKRTADGRRQIADFMLPGDLFGFLANDDYGFTAEAVSDVILFAYPQYEIDRLATTMPSVRKRVLARLTQNMRTMQSHLLTRGHHTAKGRVAAFFLRLSERNGSIPGDRLDLSMGRQDIADHLGLTIEEVCRAIAELKRDRMVTVPNANQVIVNEPDLLQALADGEPGAVSAGVA